MAYIAYTKGKEPKPRTVTVEQAINAGRFDPARFGLKGAAGFMGRSTYGTTNRKAGYLR
jgi:hypothetical protein